MPRLSSKLCSLLTERVLEELKTIEIITVDDFIAAVKTESIFRCQSSLSEQEIRILNSVLVLMFGELPLSAAELEERQAATLSLSTGSERVDSLLGGGIKTGNIIQLLGPERAEFCLNFISTVLLSSGSSCVVYIDSWNGFNVRRLKDILETERPTQDLNSLLNRLTLFTATDIFQLMSLISVISNKLSSEEESHSNNIKLILIDSLINLLLPVTGCDNEVLKLLQDLFSTLRQLTLDHSIAILYTSTPNPFRTKGQLKDEWVKLPDATIQLSSEQDNPVLVTTKR